MEITSFSNLLNPIVVEYQSDAADNDEEYDVQYDDESVIFLNIILLIIATQS